MHFMHPHYNFLLTQLNADTFQIMIAHNHGVYHIHTTAQRCLELEKALALPLKTAALYKKSLNDCNNALKNLNDTKEIASLTDKINKYKSSIAKQINEMSDRLMNFLNDEPFVGDLFTLSRIPYFQDKLKNKKQKTDKTMLKTNDTKIDTNNDLKTDGTATTGEVIKSLKNNEPYHPNIRYDKLQKPKEADPGAAALFLVNDSLMHTNSQKEGYDPSQGSQKTQPSSQELTQPLSEKASPKNSGEKSPAHRKLILPPASALTKAYTSSSSSSSTVASTVTTSTATSSSSSEKRGTKRK